jgi:hypothetical protein
MTIQIGDAVALCYSGNHGTRRIRNVIVTKVKKTFIEIEDGDRFSPIDGRQIRTAQGQPGLRNYYLDANVAGWHVREEARRSIQELQAKYAALTSAAQARDWDRVKASFSELAKFIGEE